MATLPLLWYFLPEAHTAPPPPSEMRLALLAAAALQVGRTAPALLSLPRLSALLSSSWLASAYLWLRLAHRARRSLQREAARPPGAPTPRALWIRSTRPAARVEAVATACERRQSFSASWAPPCQPSQPSRRANGARASRAARRHATPRARRRVRQPCRRIDAVRLLVRTPVPSGGDRPRRPLIH